MAQFSHSAPLPVRRQVTSALSAPCSSPASIQSILPAMGITQRRLKQIEAIQLVREHREQGKQDLAFNARPFVLCGLPLRRPPSDQLTHTRRNGKFFLQVIGHPQFGLPYGQDRLIPIWVATMAVRQRSRIVRFGAASEVLDFFHLFKDGKTYHRIMEGFQRIFAATIFFGANDQTSATVIVDWARFHFFDRMHLWFHTAEEESPAPGTAENSITLSEAFYEEIDKHPIPVEREVVSMLANAPGVLDLYLWLVWKTWSLNGHSVRIPLFTSGGLADQLGGREYCADRFFRRKLNHWLSEIKVLWPECPAVISKDGRMLILRSSKKSPAVSAVVPCESMRISVSHYRSTANTQPPSSG
ncbi:MAG: replication protein RepA [Terriglobia bacterium]